MGKNFFLLFFGFLTISPTSLAAEDKALSIIQEILSKLAPPKWQGEFDFTNFRVDKSEHKYTLLVVAQNRKTVRVSFLAPKTDKGREILNDDGRIWGYLPDSKKIIQLADRDSIANGDFSNADVMKFTWDEEYNSKMVKETAKQLIIDLDKKPGTKASYDKMRLWVLKESVQPVQQYFYDSSGNHLKTLKYRKVKNFEGIERPSELIMENVITGQRTLLIVKSFNRVSKHPVGYFQRDNLGK